MRALLDGACIWPRLFGMLGILRSLPGGLPASAGVSERDPGRSEKLRQELTALGESRKRIVEAQNAETRRLEREIHDGAQQQLVSLSVKLGLAKQTLAQNPEKTSEILDELRKDTGDVLDTLRELARKLFPAILEDRGLGSAIQAHVDRMNICAKVQDELEGRRGGLQEEACIYFVVREALENVGEGPAGKPVLVRLWVEGAWLHFEVGGLEPGWDAGKDRGPPKLRNMEDRLEAMGGEITTGSPACEGIAIRGKAPYQKK